ncbi:MAG TPA: 1,4-alpha-glucan branching protein GlgB [Steroidobacteraceae bacterium]|nr:1,4-alpha-glucan branching protein GlgB [Steroidobacteraceae bacterium]
MNVTHHEPRSLLGYHEFPRTGDVPLCVVRVLEPGAESIDVYWEDTPGELHPLKCIHDAGLFEGNIPQRRPVVPYRLRVRFPFDHVIIKHDTYFFSHELSEFDLYLFGEGRHYGLYHKFGAHLRVREGVAGTNFAVWAPNARRVSVVGSFNHWDGRKHAMQARGSSGVWELFVPGVTEGAQYKYEIHTKHGSLLLKSDPFAFFMQRRPETASVVTSLEDFEWHDGDWLRDRAARDWRRSPINIYEVHLSSWQHSWDRQPPFFSWAEAAERLIPYVVDMGYTHIELMGVAEHPFDGSWGYQVVGYYAPTSRYGTPKDFMAFVDKCHQAGIGVILDWVPAHFPKDAHGLAEFDGSSLYEHADPRLGEHSDWGTKIFNYGRHEVKNFLVANALYWMERFHIDGLRVDAVASMLYLDYSRKAGEWLPNKYGGRENLEALEFLREFNTVAHANHPGVLTIAEESTAFPGVSRPVHLGGVGFSFKWNMGWMNDTLHYFEKDPVYRRHEHNKITFSFMYAWSENFILPISHDEVVHGKKSLLDKMPGDEWQKRANYRLFLSYMTAHPGKKLMFMGSEFGQWHEWREHEQLDWPLLQNPAHRGLQNLNRELARFYREHPQFHASDCDAGGFRWSDLHNADESVFVFLRQEPGHAPIVCLFNATPVPRDDYWLGVPDPGRYAVVFDSDHPDFGGAGFAGVPGYDSFAHTVHGFPHALRVRLPPLAAVFLIRQV